MSKKPFSLQLNPDDFAPATVDEKQELDELGVKQLVVDFKVNTLTAYAGGRTGCMAFGMSEAYSWKKWKMG